MRRSHLRLAAMLVALGYLVLGSLVYLHFRANPRPRRQAVAAARGAAADTTGNYSRARILCLILRRELTGNGKTLKNINERPGQWDLSEDDWQAHCDLYEDAGHTVDRGDWSRRNQEPVISWVLMDQLNQNQSPAQTVLWFMGQTDAEADSILAGDKNGNYRARNMVILVYKSMYHPENRPAIKRAFGMEPEDMRYFGPEGSVGLMGKRSLGNTVRRLDLGLSTSEFKLVPIVLGVVLWFVFVVVGYQRVKPLAPPNLKKTARATWVALAFAALAYGAIFVTLLLPLINRTPVENGRIVMQAIAFFAATGTFYVIRHHDPP